MNKMNILCCTSNEYAPHCGVMLTSLFENNKDIIFSIYIFTTYFEEANVNLMQGLSKRYGHTLQIMEFTKESIEINPPGKWGVYPFLKLKVAEILPNIDRILYLDTDMIICRSIAEIKNIEIDNFDIALPYDCMDGEEHKIRLGIPSDNFYGCSGLVYFNLRKCRENQLWEKAKTFIKMNPEIIKYADQDVLNYICSGHIKTLGMEWNMMAYYYRTKPYIASNRKDRLDYIKKDPIIIHYTCKKPWFKDCHFPLKHLYWKYAAISGWIIKPKFSSSYNILKDIIERIRYFIQDIGIHDYCFLYKL